MKELVGARREINDACVDENISVIIDSLAVIDAFRVCCGGIFPYDQDGKFHTSSFQFKRTQNYSVNHWSSLTEHSKQNDKRNYRAN